MVSEGAMHDLGCAATRTEVDVFDLYELFGYPLCV